MLNYHIVNIKEQVFHLDKFITLQDRHKHILSHKIFIDFFSFVFIEWILNEART